MIRKPPQPKQGRNVKIVLARDTSVVALGQLDSFVVPPGGSVVDGVPDSKLADYQATAAQVTSRGMAVAYDVTTGTFKLISRAMSSDEQDIQDIQTKIRYALNNWDTLTAAQKDAALRTCVRMLGRLLDLL